MTVMSIDLEAALSVLLGPGTTLTVDQVETLLRDNTRAAHANIEESFGSAGWYTREADPYPPPGVVTRPDEHARQLIYADRRLWISRYRPENRAFEYSDIDDDRQFPWLHPEGATRGGWWLNTKSTPLGSMAINEVATGDLVVCQRTDPGSDRRRSTDRYKTDMLVGLCTVGLIDAWHDAETGHRERSVCLVPLAKFKYPVPRRTARNYHRLLGKSFSHPRQLPDRHGRIAFGLSAVDWVDAIDLLSVCGIPPAALSEPDTSRLAARLRASETGNPLFLRLWYDAVLQDRVRRVHERQAEKRAQAWAQRHGYVLRQGFQQVANAGFDLLFADGAGRLLQVEVKGYSSKNLASIHLQPSQAQRAKEAALGVPPDWRLFALLGAGSSKPKEQLLDPTTVMQLLASGGLQTRSR